MANKLPKTMSLKDWAIGLRLHQWAKNILVFVPLILTNQLLDLTLLINVFGGFIVFGLVVSANYLINDLIDIDSDKKHPTKKNRPIASGKLSRRIATISILLLLVGSLSLIFVLPLAFYGVIFLYLMIAIFYSLVLKKFAIIDVMILAGLYSMRIISGAFLIGTNPTFWLMAFSLFIFFSLALVKRYSELKTIISLNEEEIFFTYSRRNYVSDDMPILKNIGIGSGMLSVLVFALYINSIEIRMLYDTPQLLWFALPILLFWICNIWFLASRGEMHDDPVVFALKDKLSLLSAFCMGTILFLANI